MLSEGIITKVNSDTFTVKVENEEIETKARGKFRNLKFKPVVGDQVKINWETKTIEEVKERKNVLLRPPVANINKALIITSIKKPDLNLTLLDKLISIITINKIEPVIVLTKLDLLTKKELKEILKLFKYYDKIGIKVFTNRQVKKLKKYLKGSIVTVCGQTGAGKSTLINLFDKNLHLKTDEISEALNRGKHTTRIVELFTLDKFYIVDTPGFSSLDIASYGKEAIKNSFREFNNYTCKFKDCYHHHEKGCAVVEAKNKGEILEARYQNYLRFIEESK